MLHATAALEAMAYRDRARARAVYLLHFVHQTQSSATSGASLLLGRQSLSLCGRLCCPVLLVVLLFFLFFFHIAFVLSTSPSPSLSCLSCHVEKRSG